MFILAISYLTTSNFPWTLESWLIWKDPDAGKDWGPEEKGATEDKMVGWHHQHNGHGFEWTTGVGDGQGGLACCGSWGRKESDTTEWLNWTELNLPWFMDLIFQVPMQYCSLQHQTLLPSPVTSTTGCCFSFGSIPSFFLELFLHWSPVAYWAPTNLGSPLSVSYHFAFSYCPWGSQGKDTEVVCHSLLQWTTFCQISPPWPARLGLPHGHGLVSLS